MNIKLNKNELETVVLKTIHTKSSINVRGCNIYNLTKEGEIIVVKNLDKNQEVLTLRELESAVNNPDVTSVYIPKIAAITSKSLIDVLNRASLSKNIYCAFEVKE